MTSIRYADLTPSQVRNYNKKDIYTLDDVCRHFPKRYMDLNLFTRIQDAKEGETCVVSGTISSVRAFNSGMIGKTYRFLQYDGVYFNVSVFGYSDYHPGSFAAVYGKVTHHPQYGHQITGTVITDPRKRLYPVYSQVKGVSAKKAESLRGFAFSSAKEPLERDVVKRYDLLPYEKALKFIHFPGSAQETELGRSRILFDDLLYLALTLDNGETKNEKGIPLPVTDQTQCFLKDLPFTITGDQDRVIKGFLSQASHGRRINALLQGDVGCGKTIVAVTLMILAAENKKQSVLAVPRMSLAEQHYADITRYTKGMGYETVFLHSGMKAGEKRKALERIKNGDADIIVGTHSVFSKNVGYKDLALIVTDEEHLFGSEQKRILKEKAGQGAHVISMSATPIPKTLASAIYGNSKEIAEIKEMPPGRIPVQTAAQHTHKNTFPFIKKQIDLGHQCYVVCPSIEGDEIKSIQNIYTEYVSFFDAGQIGIVHGKMKKDKISETIRKFKDAEFDILISTTVIEVGMNVPNATVIVIEQAERFGLASLHQLRGRVARGTNKAYCILISDDTENPRIKTMVDTTDGFKIAEADLLERGNGHLSGEDQSGHNIYFDEMYAHPEEWKIAKEAAAFCREHGYGQSLIDLYAESEILKEQD